MALNPPYQVGFSNEDFFDKWWDEFMLPKSSIGLTGSDEFGRKRHG